MPYLKTFSHYSQYSMTCIELVYHMYRIDDECAKGIALQIQNLTHLVNENGWAASRFKESNPAPLSLKQNLIYLLYIEFYFDISLSA